ncbi:MAG: hypothetical protein OXR66_00735 [Candidatus Woesearchaeota archaeon]|nr:hypothetical protein [Candidatus Woesearchaeota archaeon]
MYAAVLEVLHALALLDRFTVRNHLCFTYFLRDYHNRHDLSVLFDRCRKKRNSLVYYGKLLTAAEVEQRTQDTYTLLHELSLILEAHA